MEAGAQLQRFYRFHIQRLILIVGLVVMIIVVSQVSVFPTKVLPFPSDVSKVSAFFTVGNATGLRNSELGNISSVRIVVSNSVASTSENNSGVAIEKEDLEEDKGFLSIDVDGEKSGPLRLDEDEHLHIGGMSTNNLDLDKSSRNFTQTDSSSIQGDIIEAGQVRHIKEPIISSEAKPDLELPSEISGNMIQKLKEDPGTAFSSKAEKISSSSDMFIKKRGTEPMSISQMVSVLLQSSVSSRSTNHWTPSSSRDRELQRARSQIQNAPIISSSSELHASLFRNLSMFVRSYELMERVLKVYIYKEGEKPVFHQPKMRGIYSSEGWFMKLMEGNKQFVARDPRKAHLFYLPFSSVMLRNLLSQEAFSSHMDLQRYLKNYTDVISRKYRFWNRTRGADHFLVACHDWAPKITRNNMGDSIRALCNTNLASGFRIGKDVSLPVTSIRSSQNPQRDIGGNPPSDRPILAFFAGRIHGYLRPLLLKYWENKEADMKIIGPMPHDSEGKNKYQEYMKSSKYCICARGYEVHTPRVVEAIYHGCVPVIISDNYVPPFFELLDWEAFAVFIPESGIKNLRNVLVSITEEKFLKMHERVKLLQRHFLWHKEPVKYDLFHMILHSVWYNRVFQA